MGRQPRSACATGAGHVGAIPRRGPIVTVLEILRTGLTLVQDLGRPGLAHLGVSPSGAADRRAHALANRLDGNAAANIITGNDGNNAITGAAGNDFLDLANADISNNALIDRVLREFVLPP